MSESTPPNQPVIMATAGPATIEQTPASAFEMRTLPPYDAGAPLHTHPHHAETCYVIAGTLALMQNEHTAMLRRGSTGVVPSDVAHTYWNPTATTTTVLVAYTPSTPPTPDAAADDLAGTV